MNETKNKDILANNNSEKRIWIRRILLPVLLAFCMLLIVSLLLLPTLAKNYLNKNGKELVGRTLHIDKLKLNYFTSTLRIIGFQLFEQNESDVFASFDTLMVNMKPLKLLSDEIYVQQLQLVNSDAYIIQNDDVFNFSDLLDFYATEPANGEEMDNTNEQTSYKLNLRNIELRRGSLAYTDKTIDHTVNMVDLSFIIPQIYWNQPDSSKADIEFNLPNGGHFSSSLNYNMDIGSFNGWAQLQRIDLDVILPYLQQYIMVSDVDGKFTSKISFSGMQDNVDELVLSGTARVDSLILFDENKRKIIGAEQYKVVLNSAEPLKQKINIDLVQIEKPYVYFALIDSLSNFEKMLVILSETEEIIDDLEDNNTEYPLEVSINHLLINDGLIDFSDQRFREEFLYELSEVMVDMDTLELNDNWVNIKANMKLNKRGNLEAQLGMHPFAMLDSIQLNYVLSDFQLPDLNMYSKEYVGLPILFGDMYYVNNTSIVNKQIESDNELIIRNVEMGRKSGGIYDVPIKLALFILKDKNGDIILDVPVTGDLSDPKTRIGPIVWNTLKGFMVKVVASPFKALGNMLGADPKDLEELTFDYADTVLVRNQIKSLDLLLELEQEKPELQIDLHYLNDKKLERTDVARQLSHQFFLRDKQRNAASNRNDYLKYLEESTGQDSMVMQDYELLLAPETMVDSVIQYNESLRLKNVRSYLGEKNDSTAMRIFGYNTDEVQNIGSRPKLQIKYSLAEEVEE